jgi:hypothetical protein
MSRMLPSKALLGLRAWETPRSHTSAKPVFLCAYSFMDSRSRSVFAQLSRVYRAFAARRPSPTLERIFERREHVHYRRGQADQRWICL